MRPRGTIYKSGGPKHGQTYIALPKPVRVFYHFARGIGLGLITAAIAGVLLAYGPIAKEEASYQLKTVGIREKPDYTTAIASANEVSTIQNETSELGLDSHFALFVPKIDAKANIVANVDPANANIYSEALMKGVAHAQGTYFPGQGKPIFLFAHSTNTSFNISRYNAIFYLLSKLEEGDDVIVYFADKKYHYVVKNKMVMSPEDISLLKEAQTGMTERLVLMTCTPPGTTWQRLFVIAEPVVDKQISRS